MSLYNAGVERYERLLDWQMPYQLGVPLLMESTPHNQPLYTAHHQQQNPNYAYGPPTYQNADPLLHQCIRDKQPWQQPPDPPDWQQHPQPPPYGFHDSGTIDHVAHGHAMTTSFGVEHYSAPTTVAPPHTSLYTEPYRQLGEQRPLPRLEPAPDPPYGLTWFGPREEQPSTAAYGQPTYMGFESSVYPRNPHADSQTRPPDYHPPWPITNGPEPSDQSWYFQASHQPWQAGYQSAPPPPPDPIVATLGRLLSKLTNLERRLDASECRTAGEIWVPPLPDPDPTYNPAADDYMRALPYKQEPPPHLSQPPYLGPDATTPLRTAHTDYHHNAHPDTFWHPPSHHLSPTTPLPVVAASPHADNSQHPSCLHLLSSMNKVTSTTDNDLFYLKLLESDFQPENCSLKLNPSTKILCSAENTFDEKVTYSEKECKRLSSCEDIINVHEISEYAKHECEDYSNSSFGERVIPEEIHNFDNISIHAEKNSYDDEVSVHSFREVAIINYLQETFEEKLKTELKQVYGTRQSTRLEIANLLGVALFSMEDLFTDDIKDFKWDWEESLDISAGVTDVEESKSKDEGHVFNVKKLKSTKLDDLLYTLSLKVKEIYSPMLSKPQFADLVALSDIKPKCVYHLDRRKSPFTLAIVTCASDDASVMIRIVFSVLLENNKNGDGLSILCLANLNTNDQILGVLPLCKQMNTSIFTYVLSVSPSVEGNCGVCCSKRIESTKRANSREIITSFGLDDLQKVAVLNCAALIECSHIQNVKLVWGPPLTGKTRAISSLVYTLLKLMCWSVTIFPTNVVILGVFKRLMWCLSEESSTLMQCYVVPTLRTRWISTEGELIR